MDSGQQNALGGWDSPVRPVDANPYLFRTGRVPLAIEGVLLIALGVWGLAANSTYPVIGPAGAPVLVFHFTVLHSWVLLTTGVLAVISARRRRIALIFTGFQFMGYMLLFAIGSVAFARSARTPMSFDALDSVLHLIVAAVGAAVFLWLAGQIMEGPWWVRDRSQAERSDPPPSRSAVRQASPLPSQHLDPAIRDTERFALGLQDDSKLDRVKLGVGAVSVVTLVAMFVTSLFRAPSTAATVVLAALAVGIGGKVIVAILRGHRTVAPSPSDGSHSHHRRL
jgi:hypothetical protein